jgi:hypothetical protein
MPRLQVAHLREQGQDMIIMPLDSSVGQKVRPDQNAIITELQVRARAAGLAGLGQRRRSDDVHRAEPLAPLLSEHQYSVCFHEHQPQDMLVR